MPNMDYVMFENTYRDLLDAQERLQSVDSDNYDDREKEYAKKLVRLCSEIAEEFEE